METDRHSMGKCAAFGMTALIGVFSRLTGSAGNKIPLSHPAGPFQLFFDLHEPEIDLVHLADVFVEHGLIGVGPDIALVVAILQVENHLVEFVHLRVHDAQIADQPDLFNVQPFAVVIAGAVRSVFSGDHASIVNRRLCSSSTFAVYHLGAGV
jgi:hypothetical protein